MAKQIPEMSEAELQEAHKTLSAVITLMWFLGGLAVLFLVHRTYTYGFEESLTAVAAVVVILGGSIPSLTRRAAIRAELGKRATS
jgi:hypothetical protein